MKEYGIFDEQFIDLDTACVHMEDRGYQFGDGVYEAVHVYNGKCFALDRHLKRLRRSLKELRIPIKFTDIELVGMHEDLIEKSGINEGSIYFQFTRGHAPRVHQFPAKIVAHLSMVIREGKIKTEQQKSGIAVVLEEDIRWLRCDIKSLNLLGNVLAKQNAHEKNAVEAVLYRKDKNIITEGSSSNFFIVKDGVLFTHPADNFILKGITRSIILEELVTKLDVPVVEKTFTPEFALKADEAFVTSTSLELTPVTSIDKHAIGDGKPGLITTKLLALYKELVEQECNA